MEYHNRSELARSLMREWRKLLQLREDLHRSRVHLCSGNADGQQVEDIELSIRDVQDEIARVRAGITSLIRGEPGPGD